MLSKLLKYEFRSVSKLLTPMLFGVLGLSVLASFIINLNTQFSGVKIGNSVIEAMLSFLFVIIIMLTILAIIAFAVVTFVALMHRFYKNLFTDEGYLSLTLPVTAGQQINAKLIAASVWTLISGVVTAIAIFIIVLIGTASKGNFINHDIFKFIGEFFNQASPFITPGVVLASVQTIILMLIAIPSSILTFYLAITIGAIIAKKHKVLAAIGIYFGINTALSVVSSIVNIIIMAVFGNSFNETSNVQSVTEFERVIKEVMPFANAYMFCNIVIYVGLGIACFFFCKWLITKKLNLA